MCIVPRAKAHQPASMFAYCLSGNVYRVGLLCCGLLFGWLCATNPMLACPQSESAQSKDWPQINGQFRNGVAPSETLFDTWPEKLNELWSHPVGQGFSGPVVVDGRVYVFHRPGKSYLCEAINAETGQPIWTKSLPANYSSPGPDGDLGPKAVPLVYKNSLILLGTGGELYSLNLKDGEIVWQKKLQQEYSSPSGYFGSGSSPIVSDGKLILNVGGRDAAVVAFDPGTGKEIWKSFDDRASYSSPIEVQFKGKKAIGLITRFHFAVFNTDDGSVLYKTPFGVRGPSVNGAMPVDLGDGKIFINSAYGVGAKLIQLNGDNSKEVWGNDESFSSQYSTPILYKGMLYGTAGREDYQNGSFRCIDPETGKVAWSSQISVGHGILVGDQIVFLDSLGTLYVIKPNQQKLDKVFEQTVFGRGSRSMSALSDGLFFTRSNAIRGKGELKCLQVGPRTSK